MMLTKTCLLSAALFALVSVAASPSFAQTGSSTDDDNRFFAQYRSSAWAENFQGWHYRQWTGPTDNWNVGWLHLAIDQNAGGWDTTIARNNPVNTRIDQTNTGRYLGYEYDFTNLRGSGAWWCGAKVVVHRDKVWREGISTLVGNYECYIIENSDLSEQGLKDRFGLQYEGQSWHDGRQYKHYTDTLENGILQVWSIRAGIPRTAKSSGDREYIPVGQIKRQWRLNKWNSGRLIKQNWYPLGWMAFLETQGDNYGNNSNSYIGSFSNLWLPYNGKNLYQN